MFAGAVWGGAQFILGDVFGMMNNKNCFDSLGCNAGFFGFDALVHFLAGFLFIAGVLWYFHKRPKKALLSDSLGKNIFILLAIVALLGVGWEIFEFSADTVRTVGLHMNLQNPNHLAQPSDADTMGDLIFEQLGALVSIIWLWRDEEAKRTLKGTDK